MTRDWTPVSTTPTGGKFCPRYCWCRWHRWQFATGVNDTNGNNIRLLFKVNLKKKIYLYVYSTSQRCPTNILKTSLIEEFFHLSSKKFELALMEYSGARRKLIQEKVWSRVSVLLSFNIVKKIIPLPCHKIVPLKKRPWVEVVPNYQRCAHHGGPRLRQNSPHSRPGGAQLLRTAVGQPTNR